MGQSIIHPGACPNHHLEQRRNSWSTRFSPLTATGTVGESEADRRGGWPGSSSSTRCAWFSRRPHRGWSWIDYLRLPGARSAHTRSPHASPRSPHPRSHCHAHASASLSRSTRALLTALAQGRKLPRTPSSTPEPRAPPADLASDDAGGSGEVGLQPSRGGRPMVGRLGRAVLAAPRFASRVWQGCCLFEMSGDCGGDCGDFGGAMGGAMGGAVDGAARRVWG